MIYSVVAIVFLCLGGVIGYFICSGIVAHKSKTHQLVWDEETKTAVWKRRVRDSHAILRSFAALVDAVERRHRITDIELNELTKKAKVYLK